VHTLEEMHGLFRPSYQRQLPLVAVAFFAPLRLCEKLKKNTMTENAIAKEIVDAAYRIHTSLSPACWNPYTIAS
jgi:hypothetical protein